MTHPIIQSFLAISEGLSPDRVVADAALNERFLSQCKELGVLDDPSLCNRRLLNARKAGLLKSYKTTCETRFRNDEQYRYAAEIAARHLERKLEVTLDDILCDPILANQFDLIAGEIAPGFTSLEYRWAALNLRKSNRLRPELLSHIVKSTGVQIENLKSLSFDSLPMGQGIYLFYGPHETLYVGEAQCLRRRIEKHLDHSDSRDLARWFWEHGFKEVNLEIQELPMGTSTRVRRALESELIASRRPIFNIRRN